MAVAASGSGEIFFATQADGASRGWGHHSIRKLTPLADGKFKQTILSRTAWVSQLSYHKQVYTSGITQELLLASAIFGAGNPVFDLKTGSITYPFTAINGNYNTGAVIAKTQNGADYEFYVSSKDSSKIYRYNNKFQLVETFGRDVFDDISNPLTTVIGHPDSVIEDPTAKNTYVLDSKNAVIRKITPTGVISNLAGKNQDFGLNQAYNNAPLDSLRLYLSGFTYGYPYRLTGNFNSAGTEKILYVSVSSGRVHAIDLVGNKVTTLAQTLPGSAAEDQRFNWGNHYIAFAKHGLENLLYIGRYYNVETQQHPSEQWHKPFVSFFAKNTLSSSGLSSTPEDFMGNYLLNTSANNTTVMNNSDVEMPSELGSSIVIDDEGTTYVSGTQFKISTQAGLKTRILPFSMTAFTVLKEGSKRHAVYYVSSGLSVLTVDLSGDIFDTSYNPIQENGGKAKKLCVPGTLLNNVRQISQNSEGNLLIADGNNARVLTYLVHDKNGTLKFNYCP